MVRPYVVKARENRNVAVLRLISYRLHNIVMLLPSDKARRANSSRRDMAVPPSPEIREEPKKKVAWRGGGRQAGIGRAGGDPT